MRPAPRRLTLLTDFGTRDGYVAAMRGVIAAIAPETITEDATHDIPPGDIVAGAFALERYWHLYPPGTVHVAVVDPGVGTARCALVASADGRHFVAPDNGILTLAFESASSCRFFEVRNAALLRSTISATFHGRDVFAPVAAHIAAGVAPESVGPAFADPVRLTFDSPRRDGDRIHGVVLVEDRFGNLITNIAGDDVAVGGTVRVADHNPIRIHRTYGDVEPGGLVALIGSTGRLELSVRDGSAEATLGIRRGVAVTAHRRP